MKNKRTIFILAKILYLGFLVKAPLFIKGLSPVKEHVLVYKDCQKTNPIRLPAGTYTDSDRLQTLKLTYRTQKKVKLVIPQSWQVGLYSHEFVTEDNFIRSLQSSECFVLQKKIKAWRIEKEKEKE